MPEATRDERSQVFDPARHRPLDAAPWSPDVVRGEIAAIASAFEAALRPDRQAAGRAARRGRARHGQGRYTLWTGDGGFAVYLHHCLLQREGPAATRFPGLETF